MVDSPDPLGKRALFWAPAERDEVGPRSGLDDEDAGKHALFSSPSANGTARKRRPSPRVTQSQPASHPSGAGRARAKAPSLVAPPTTGSASRRVATSPPHTPRPNAGMFGSISIECSACGSRSDVDMLEFAMLHMPLWFWRPGRGFTQFMTCPSCRRRTWVSASWSPKGR